MLLNPKPSTLREPASGIRAFGGLRRALKPARRTCERPYPPAIGCYGVEILTSSRSAIGKGRVSRRKSAYFAAAGSLWRSCTSSSSGTSAKPQARS